MHFNIGDQSLACNLLKVGSMAAIKSYNFSHEWLMRWPLTSCKFQLLICSHFPMEATGISKEDDSKLQLQRASNLWTYWEKKTRKQIGSKLGLKFGISPVLYHDWLVFSHFYKRVHLFMLNLVSTTLKAGLSWHYMESLGRKGLMCYCIGTCISVCSSYMYTM